MNIITKIKKIFVKKPQRILAAGFLFIILIGAILLSLPIATKDFVWTPFIDSLFTSTSAVCVTGLVTVNTAKHWSTFGHLVIIILIQIGGLGFMTATTLVAMILGKKITLKSRGAHFPQGRGAAPGARARRAADRLQLTSRLMPYWLWDLLRL